MIGRVLSYKGGYAGDFALFDKGFINAADVNA
jgi:hypothetical protein